MFYPTAIGWHRNEVAEVRKRQHEAWETIQRGHAIANGVFVAAVNRVGVEDGLEFWGGSFVADPFGEVIARASATREEILLVECDLAKIEETRRNWPFLRDRRIDAYGDLTRASALTDARIPPASPADCGPTGCPPNGIRISRPIWSGRTIATRGPAIRADPAACSREWRPRSRIRTGADSGQRRARDRRSARDDCSSRAARTAIRSSSSRFRPTIPGFAIMGRSSSTACDRRARRVQADRARLALQLVGREVRRLRPRRRRAATARRALRLPGDRARRSCWRAARSTSTARARS